MSEAVKIRGWTFERMEDGLVRVEKERLVADSILLDEGEWEEIVSTLWVPGQAGEEEEHPEDGPDDEPGW